MLQNTSHSETVCCYFEIPKQLNFKHALGNVKCNCEDKCKAKCERRAVGAFFADRSSSNPDDERDRLKFDGVEFHHGHHAYDRKIEQLSHTHIRSE